MERSEMNVACSALLAGDALQRQHCGLIAATRDQVAELMTDLLPVVETCPGQDDYRFDIKVHMLMPGQWPCIPNWHFDFVPRDAEKRQQFDLIRDDAPPMYFLVSEPPLTEFRDGRLVEPWAWVPFSQRDEHRGTKAEDFGWRLFIRAAHESLVPRNALAISGLRRHSQVYLEAGFEW